MDLFRPNPNLKLMEQVTQVLSYHHYAKATQKSYCSWIRHYIGFHKNRHPSEMGKAEIELFLAYLAETRNVSPSTQKQALNAIVFLYKRVLFIPVSDSLELVRAKKRVRIPVVLSQAEVQDVLFNMQGTYRLMGRLMYGGGLRLMECIRLRVKDIDFSRGKLYIHMAKGGKDRVTLLPNPNISRVERAHIQGIRAADVVVYLNALITQKMGALGSPEG